MAYTPSISFEFFPPKDDGSALWNAIIALSALNPKFVSVTYGAGGSTRDRTHSLVKRIREETTLEPAAHLTCVGASRDDIRRIAEEYWKAGIKHIVALRGDAPVGKRYKPHPDGYAYADTLVAGLKEVGGFEISVAAYPEGHPQAVNFDEDLAHLKRKFAAGADQAITQYFFDTNLFAPFVKKARALGIGGPIYPGVLPIGNYTQMVKFSAMCGASVPDFIHARFKNITDKQQAFDLAVQTAAEQCQALIKDGVEHIHFYTLNKPELVMAICERIGIQA